jgi:hypothetical protein
MINEEPPFPVSIYWNPSKFGNVTNVYMGVYLSPWWGKQTWNVLKEELGGGRQVLPITGGGKSTPVNI